MRQSPYQDRTRRGGRQDGGGENRREQSLRSASNVTPVSDLAGGSRCARVLDVSETGAFVTVGDECPAEVGDILSLAFRLPNGPELRLAARVHWCRAEADDEGPAGYGVSFSELDETQRASLAAYVATRGDQQTPVHAEVGSSFRVSAGQQKLWAQLNGSLSPNETRTLAREVGQALESLAVGPALVHIDARRFRVCPESSLPGLRHTLGLLAERGSVLGLIVGESSVGMLQLRRLARESGVGDVLACFEDEAEATVFWQQLERSTRSVGG